MRIFISLLFIFLTAATAGAERLRFASYNVQNYLLLDFRRVEGRVEPAYPKPEREKEALRLVIMAANADVLALQEIGNEAFVRELCRDLERLRFAYPHVAILDGPDKRRQLAILSRRPFKKILQHPEIVARTAAERAADRAAAAAAGPPAGQRTRKNAAQKKSASSKTSSEQTLGPQFVTRGLLGVSFDTVKGEVFFYTLHLKSRLDSADDPQSAKRRLAEADVLCRHLTATHFTAPEKPPLVLVCGDFNDEPSSAPLRRFTMPKRPPALTALPAQDSRTETWTYRNIKNDFYSRSDYFLHSPALAPLLVTPAKIADIPASLIASDHRLIFADLRLEP